MKKKRNLINKKMKIDMSVVLQTAVDPNISESEQKEFSDMLAKNYVNCLGDADIVINKVYFI